MELNFQAELLLRLILSAICGLILGYERQQHHKQAGLKTFLIVGLASCLMMEVSKYGFSDVAKVDASRIASQVVSGISFLGAGIIMKRRMNIEGLSTAAGIWAMAGIGLALGAGLYFLGIACTILYMLFNYFITRFEKHNKFLLEDYAIVTDSIHFLHKLIEENKTNKVITFNVEKDEEIYNIEISIQFANDLEKQNFEATILNSKHLVAFEHK